MSQKQQNQNNWGDNSYLIISGEKISYNEWKKNNPPDILEVYDNPQSIHKSWFGDSHYYNNTGNWYYVHPWSMMAGREIQYRYNGKIFNEEQFESKFKFIAGLPGTGGAVWIYQKISHE